MIVNRIHDNQECDILVTREDLHQGFQEMGHSVLGQNGKAKSRQQSQIDTTVYD